MNIFYKTSYTESNIPSQSLPDFSSNTSKKIKGKSIKLAYDILSNINQTKFVDSSINKFYTKFLQKQAFIQHEQKIYDILEKSDEPKIFNNLRENYIREKEDLKNLNYLQNNNRKVTDIASFVNLGNCKKKLYSIYKLSADDLGFMTSFMHHLGHRPKKIYKPKVNKKLEALSMGRLGNLLKKKEKNKNINNKKENNIYYLNNINNNVNNSNKYLKMFLKKLSNDSISNNNKTIEENKIKDSTENIREINENNINNYQQKNNITKNFLKKKTLNMNTNNIKLFKNTKMNDINSNNYKTQNQFDKNKKFSLNYNNMYLKYKSKSKNESFKDEVKDESNLESKDNFIKKTNTFQFNNKNIKPETINQMNYYRDAIINKANIQTNTQNNEIKINIEDELSNDEKKDNKKDETQSSINTKKINNNEDKSKIVKLYKTSMNEFLQKVKQEGNILNKKSNRLSYLLYKLKNENFETFQNERNKNKNQSLSYKNAKTVYTEANYNNKNKERKKLGRTFYQGMEKSRYRIPYINKIVYGEKNIYDTFEELQKELFYEVKTQIRKAELANKRRKKKVNTVIGINILNKLIRQDSDDALKNELEKINNSTEQINNHKKKTARKKNQVNENSNKKNN